MGNSYNGEGLRAELTFADGSGYTVDTFGSPNYTSKAHFLWVKGNDKADPLGIPVSSSVSLELYDPDDNLSPINTASPYYGLLELGIKVNMFITYDGGSMWQPYGEFYASGITGTYNNGSVSMAQIDADDIINTIMNSEAPGLQIGANVPVGDLLVQLFDGINEKYGFDFNYEVDPSIASQTISIGVFGGNLVRDVIKEICHATLSRIYSDRYKIICILPALTPFWKGSTWNLGPEDLGDLRNEINPATNFNNVEIRYFTTEGGNFRSQQIHFQTTDLTAGTNTLDINFSEQVRAVEGVEIIFDNSGSTAAITSVEMQAYHRGGQLIINATDTIEQARITIFGSVVAGGEQRISQRIADRLGGATFTHTSNQFLTTQEAQQYLQNFIQYLLLISRRVSVSGTLLTPQIFIGDAVTISGTGTAYDGNYVLSEVNINFSEGYSAGFKAVRIS
jgi:hypothetical protein